MKRLILPIIVLLLCSACTGEVGRIAPNFTVDDDVEIRYMQNEYTAHVKTGKAGELTAVIKSPKTLKGITVTCSESRVTVGCGELKFEAGGGYIPFSTLYKTLKSAEASEPVSVRTDGEKTVYKYDGFTVEADAETHKIEHIDTDKCVYEMR